MWMRTGTFCSWGCFVVRTFSEMDILWEGCFVGKDILWEGPSLFFHSSLKGYFCGRCLVGRMFWSEGSYVAGRFVLASYLQSCVGDLCTCVKYMCTNCVGGLCTGVQLHEYILCRWLVYRCTVQVYILCRWLIYRCNNLIGGLYTDCCAGIYTVPWRWLVYRCTMHVYILSR